MTIERGLRLMAGTFVLLSLALGYWVSPYWYLFPAFVGLNLLQSGFTNWCPDTGQVRAEVERERGAGATCVMSEAHNRFWRTPCPIGCGSLCSWLGMSC